MASSRKRNGDGDICSGSRKRRNPGDLHFIDESFEVEETDSSDDDEINGAEEHSMNIFINNLEGKFLFSREVKPSETIGELKARMNWDVLIFKGVSLHDSGTLVDFNVSDGATLTCVGMSKVKMEIFVEMFKGSTICLLVDPMDTIAKIKLQIKQIMYMERIPVPTEEQVLIFNGMALGDSGTLVDFHINRKSTLNLVRRSRPGSMQISIKTFKEVVITVDVNPSHTIGSVKSKIQDKVDIPQDEQELIFNGMVLNNIDTFAALHINEGSTLLVARISTGCMDVIIKMQNGDTIIMKVKPSSTIYNLRSKIGDMKGFLRCQLILYFNGKCLRDSGTLADHHIRNNSTIVCGMRTGGVY